MTRPRVQCVRLRELGEFAAAEVGAARRGKVVPISVSRARAWQHNPHASPDDVVLLVARCGGDVSGYLGLLPGRIRVDGSDERVDWLSSFYVPPELREAGIGALLLMRACALGNTLAASGSSPEAQRTYPALGFAQPGAVNYRVLDLLRGNLAGVPLRALRKGLSLRSRGLDLAVEMGARLTKACVHAALGSALPPPRDFHVKPIDGLRDAAFERAADARAPVRFLRDARVVDWMLRHPWVTTDPLRNTPGYYFDDFRDAFSYRVLELHDARGARGFAVVWLTTRRGVRDVHLLDHHLEDARDAHLLPSLLLACARDFRADRIHLPERCEPVIQRSGPARRLFAPRRRATYLRPARGASALRAALPQLELDYCDGDIPFA